MPALVYPTCSSAVDHARAQFGTQLGVDGRRRRFLDQLLMAPLNAAFALAEVHDVPVLVAEHLKLDMARPLDEFFDVQIGNAKRLLRLIARGGKCGPEVQSSLRTTRMPRPPPPADAFKITGYLMRVASASAAASSATIPCEPGTTGTPAAAISRRA